MGICWDQRDLVISSPTVVQTVTVTATRRGLGPPLQTQSLFGKSWNPANQPLVNISYRADGNTPDPHTHTHTQCCSVSASNLIIAALPTFLPFSFSPTGMNGLKSGVWSSSRTVTDNLNTEADRTPRVFSIPQTESNVKSTGKHQPLSPHRTRHQFSPTEILSMKESSLQHHFK